MPKPSGELHGNRMVMIEDVSVPVKYELVPLDNVKLDPDNPRIRHRVKELSSNGHIKPDDLRKIIWELPGVQELLPSIRENGGLVEPIFLRDDGRVAEGNCRTVIYLKLSESKNPEKWKKIPCYRLPKNTTERQIAVLQANFHLAGKVKWRSYEQSGQVWHMYKALKMDVEAIAKATRLQQKVVLRHLDTHRTMTDELLPVMKKLNPKMKDGEFLKKYSHFEEFYKIKKFADFRKSKSHVKLIVKLVAEGKIPKGVQMRQVAEIIDNPAAMAKLKDKGIVEAVKVASQKDPTLNSSLLRQVEKMTETLESMKNPDLVDLKENQRSQKLILKLYKAVKDVMETAKI